MFIHNNSSVSLYTKIPLFLYTQQRQRLSVIGSVYLCKVHQHFSYGTDHCVSTGVTKQAAKHF
jgi:hypothetical protein